MEMYEVCAKCGHVGRNNYVDKVFAVKATSGKEAAAKVRNFPRVKHNHSDAIRYVEHIDEARFNEINRINDSDPYFHCTSIQQQRATCNLNIFPENVIDPILPRVEIYSDNNKTVYYHKQKIRKPRKYMNNYLAEVRYAI